MCLLIIYYMSDTVQGKAYNNEQETVLISLNQPIIKSPTYEFTNSWLYPSSRNILWEIKLGSISIFYQYDLHLKSFRNVSS